MFQIISGGQNGVDQAGLRAAKFCGLRTGGFLPLGCITLDGPRRDFLQLYDMQEHHLPGYPPRTEANVKMADATIRIASNFGSAGEKCTLRHIRWYNRPDMKVDIRKELDVNKVVDWIVAENVKILNVAGNSEQTSPGIGKIAEEFLIEVFQQVLAEYRLAT